jgi:hypothetical protein
MMIWNIGYSIVLGTHYVKQAESLKNVKWLTFLGISKLNPIKGTTHRKMLSTQFREIKGTLHSQSLYDAKQQASQHSTFSPAVDSWFTFWQISHA